MFKSFLMFNVTLCGLNLTSCSGQFFFVKSLGTCAVFPVFRLSFRG